MKRLKSRIAEKFVVISILVALIAISAAGCGIDPQKALILDIFDLIDRYYIEKVDQRELVADAFQGVVDSLKAEVRFEEQSKKVKEYLQAKEKGEDKPLPAELMPNSEESPTPIPTPYDQVEIVKSAADISIKVGTAEFKAPLDADKRKLADVILNGVAFLKQTLQLERTQEDLLQLALDAMVQTLDPHSGFLNLADYTNLREDTEGSFGGVGIEIGLRDGFLTVISPIEGTPAHKAGLQSQDRIVGIDGVDTLGQTLMWAVQRLRGKIGTDVIMTIKRPGEEKTFDAKITRAKIEAVAIKSQLWPGKIGYVRITQFNARTGMDLEVALQQFTAEAGQLRGLVLDLRNNPGGLFEQTIEVTEKFLQSGLIVNTIGRGLLQDRERFSTGGGHYTNLPLVVMVNSGSASASEIVAGALRDQNRALVVGFQTFGKGSVQSIFELRNNSGLRLTTAYYYTPSGESIQAFGITPHVRFNLPAEENADMSFSEANLPGHLKNQQLIEAPKPSVEADVEPVYDYYVKQGWIKEKVAPDSDEGDFLLVFVKQLTTDNDWSIPGMIARAKQMLDKIPQPAPKPAQTVSTAASGE